MLSAAGSEACNWPRISRGLKGSNHLILAALSEGPAQANIVLQGGATLKFRGTEEMTVHATSDPTFCPVRRSERLLESRCCARGRRARASPSVCRSNDCRNTKRPFPPPPPPICSLAVYLSLPTHSPSLTALLSLPLLFQ